MSERTVEFLFDYGSPFSYLADTQMGAFANRTGARIIYRPILLGAVIKATGNRSPMEIPAKGAYMAIELGRWARRYGVGFRDNHFQYRNNTLSLMRGAVAAQAMNVFAAYHAAVYPAVWAEPVDLGDEAIFRKVLGDAGIDAGVLFAKSQSAEVKDALRRNTDDAIARGVFGAPAFFVGAEMFWGNDRLDFVEQVLERS